MSETELKIDWATHQSATYACHNWHYSQSTPKGKLVKVGAWEDGKFIGVVIFARGATPNLCKPYGLTQDQCVELCRIALTAHKTPVSRIMMLSIKFLKRVNPKIRLIVSFADQYQGHHGGIYQATNWIYSGQSGKAVFYRIHGKLTHPRTLGSRKLPQNIKGAKSIDKNAEAVNVPGKHRYLMPLDKEMRSSILPLARPYPKRASSVGGGTSDDQSEGGGSIPTDALQLSSDSP